jgi:hypothetical protein
MGNYLALVYSKSMINNRLPVLTVITPLNRHPFPRAIDLGRMYKSLQKLETHWEWKIVGRDPSSPAPDDRRVSCIQTSDEPAQSLNQGLREAIGLFVIIGEPCSIILPGVDDLIQALLKREDCAYGFGHTVDFERETGVEVRVPMSCPFGVIPQGEISAMWETHHTWWFVPISAIWRKEHLLALGGWPGWAVEYEIQPVIIGSLHAPSWAIDCETYRLTRFQDSPERNGEEDFRIKHSHDLLHEQLRQRRRLGFNPRN